MVEAAAPVGSVASLWRYPVKSMMGEELASSVVTERGVLGDRAFALIDRATGKVASAKHPRKWAKLFEFRATYVAPPCERAPLPPVRITWPDGSVRTSDEVDLEAAFARVFDRDVAFATTDAFGPASRAPHPDAPSLEEYWPDLEGLAHRDVVTDEPMPKNTFFDLGEVHLLTTATIDQLRRCYPEGRFEARRFRPNVVVESSTGAGFVENDWVGRTLAIGDDVRLRITGLCPRCVMTTLAQGDLPRDPGILRTAARHNGVGVGVYASVIQGGITRRGDVVGLV